MVIHRAELWWAELADAAGSEPAYRRPVLIVQADFLNRSALRTVVIAPLTSNVALRDIPGCIPIGRRDSRLPKPSVINLTQIMTINRSQLRELVHRLSPSLMRDVDGALLTALGVEPRR